MDIAYNNILNQIESMTPWTMCSEEEAMDRSRFGASEVSMFECSMNDDDYDDDNRGMNGNYHHDHAWNSNSSRSSLQRYVQQTSRSQEMQKNYYQEKNKKENDNKNNMNKNKKNSCMLFVQKYRRSVAATGASSASQQFRRRTLSDLEITVQYLIFSIFCRLAPLACHCQSSSTSNSFTVYDVVEFVHDRLRAVQVDLTSNRYLSGSPRVISMLARMIRYYFLAGYLLQGNKKFDMKLHSQQVEACLSLFQLNLSNFDITRLLFSKKKYNNDDAYSNDLTTMCVINTIDEILCYSLFFSQLEQLKNDKSCSHQIKNVTELISTIMGTSFKNNGFLSLFTRVKFSIDLIAAIQNDLDYDRYFKLLSTRDDDNNRWKVISRAIMVRSSNMVRTRALKILNKSLMKGEKIAKHEVARIIYLKDSTRAIDLCKNMKFTFDENDGEDYSVVFKVGPVDESTTIEEGKLRDDDFVFATLRSNFDNSCKDADGISLPISTDQFWSFVI